MKRLVEEDHLLTEEKIGRDVQIHVAVRKGEEEKWEELWLNVFQLANEEELQKLVKFLNQKLRRPNSFRLVHAIVILSPSRDESFKVGEFTRHRSPVERPLFYSVKGQRSDGAAIYDSACDKCRKGEGDHDAHT